jgi:hypothetical protein
LRRKHDDEPGDARHDDTGQRHGRRGNAGRIACIAIRLLRVIRPLISAEGSKVRTRVQAVETSRPRTGWRTRRPRAAANYKTVFNGAADSSSLCLSSNGPHCACPRRRCSDGRRADGARHVLCPRVSRAALSGS